MDDKLKDNLIGKLFMSTCMGTCYIRSSGPFYGYMVLISEEEINGAAFKNLSNEDLKEMGFKRGPRMNIMPIIEALKVRVLDCMNDAQSHGQQTY